MLFPFTTSRTGADLSYKAQKFHALQSRHISGHTEAKEMVGIPSERISLSSPEVTRGNSLPGTLFRAGGSDGFWSRGDYFEEPRTSWVSEKIKQCGKIVGATVNNCERGRDSLVQFASERDPPLFGSR